MKSLHFSPFLLVCLLIISSCTSRYKKADKNFEYQVIQEGNGERLQYGNFIMFHFSQLYEKDGKDTIMIDSRDIMPRIEQLDSAQLPSHYINILTKARVGDSVVMRISSTEAKLTGIIPRLPRYVKADGYIYMHFKILKSFTNEQEADNANIEEFKNSQLKIYNYRLKEFEAGNKKNKEQIAIDSKKIKDFLDQRSIQYQQGKWGTFRIMNKEGTGEKIDYRHVIAVTYQGRKFSDGKVFDSNTDSQFDHMGPYEVALSQVGKVMPGWTDGLMGLQKGSEVTLYIPSSLAYGAKGWRQVIPPNEIVIYDIRIDTVITEIDAMKIVLENKKGSDSSDYFNFPKAN